LAEEATSALTSSALITALDIMVNNAGSEYPAWGTTNSTWKPGTNIDANEQEHERGRRSINATVHASHPLRNLGDSLTHMQRGPSQGRVWVERGHCRLFPLLVGW
jgi:hypothetical protein